MATNPIGGAGNPPSYPKGTIPTGPTPPPPPPQPATEPEGLKLLQSVDTPAWPEYRSHKRVRALKIKHTEDYSKGTVLVTFENGQYAPRLVFLFGKPTPAPGWYMVTYEDSFSFIPDTQFEAENTLVTA